MGLFYACRFGFGRKRPPYPFKAFVSSAEFEGKGFSLGVSLLDLVLLLLISLASLISFGSPFVLDLVLFREIFPLLFVFSLFCDVCPLFLQGSLRA